MSFSDEQVKDVLEIKERAMSKIEKYQKEIRSLEREIEILDSIVKQSSFTKASAMHDAEKTGDVTPITVADRHVATATITASSISIILDDGVQLAEGMAPFKSFFIDRIIGDMKKKDVADSASDGRDVIDCTVRTDAGNIREITVTNYRDRRRVDEITSSVRWCLGKMIGNG